MDAGVGIPAPALMPGPPVTQLSRPHFPSAVIAPTIACSAPHGGRSQEAELKLDLHHHSLTTLPNHIPARRFTTHPWPQLIRDRPPSTTSSLVDQPNPPTINRGQPTAPTSTRPHLSAFEDQHVHLGSSIHRSIRHASPLSLAQQHVRQVPRLYCLEDQSHGPRCSACPERQAV